ncbi:phage head spike fiber domain-containing protein [Nitrosomonas communis]|uniref:phage head spike fiber domain-containing protein n=1 Tax=Nitrosomonas communis TaxID=44574 RepID=UPI003D2B9BE5
MALIDGFFASGEQGIWLDPSDINLDWRKNLLQRTEEIDHSAWGKPQSEVIANDRLAPDATMKADRVTMTAASTLILRQSGLDLRAGVTYTFKVYIYVPSAIGWTSWRLGIDFADGDQVPGEAKTLFDQWVLVELTQTLTADRTWLDLNLSKNSILNAQIGDYVWVTEAQLEVGSAATSYQKISSPWRTYIETIQTQPVMFQDSAGGVPVYGPDQPVGLFLDKSKQLVLSAEKAVNGAFAADTNWTKGTGWTIGSGVATKAPGLASNLTQNMSLLQNKFYRVSLDVTRNAGTLTIGIGNTNVLATITASDSYTFHTGTGAAADGILYLMADAAFDGTIDNLTVKEIAGNHLLVATGTARPTLRRDSNGIIKIEFDGIDDYWTSRPIDFSAKDEIFIFAGIEKLSDDALGIVAELSSNFTANSGTFCIQAPSATLEDFMFGVRGTGMATPKKLQATNPKKALLTCSADISNDQAKLRFDGAVAQETSTDLGTGNFGAVFGLYVGMRAGTAAPFKGYLYQLIIRGSVTLDVNVTKIEDFVASKMGYTLPELGSNMEARVALHPNIILANKLDVSQIDYKPDWKPEYYFQFGTGANQANKVFTDIRTIGASSTETIDLTWSTLDAIAKRLNLTKIKALILAASENNSNDILLGSNSLNNPITSFFGAANDRLRIKPGGMIALIAPDANGYAVVQGTADKLDIANDGAGSSVTYTILIMGVSN